MDVWLSKTRAGLPLLLPMLLTLYDGLVCCILPLWTVSPWPTSRHHLSPDSVYVEGVDQHTEKSSCMFSTTRSQRSPDPGHLSSSPALTAEPIFPSRVELGNRSSGIDNLSSNKQTLENTPNICSKFKVPLLETWFLLFKRLSRLSIPLAPSSLMFGRVSLI